MTNIHTVASYDRALDAIPWLCRAFGFERHAVHSGPDGAVAHAELRFGSATFGLSSTRPADPSNVWTSVRQGLYMTVADADAAHARAVEAGARIAMPLVDTSYGSRDFSAWDTGGHLWGFGTYVMGDAPELPAIFPAVRYPSGRAAAEFLARAFDLEVGLQVEADGDLVHSELWSGRGVVSVDAGPDPHDAWRDRTQCTCVVVSDPDAHHARARAAGAQVVRAPYDAPSGARAYLALDVEGFLWSFSTHQPARPLAAS